MKAFQVFLVTFCALAIKWTHCKETISERFVNGLAFYHSKNVYHTSLEGSSGSEPFLGDDVTIKWFNQSLDHFNPSENRTWLQRYYVNDAFYKPGGPIFLMIGGEGEATPKWMTAGAWITYAKQFNAMCFQVEHRFYGDSHPTEDLSVKNLRFLSSEQALADLATFTVAMKDQYNFTTNKWVAFGGSYPGSLAAWYRMKYPHLVDMAVSTSAPLEAVLDFKEYLGVVRDAIIKTNPTCVGEISKAVKSMEGLLRRRTGWWMIKSHFKLCDDLVGTNSKDVASLFETIAGNFMDIVQYNEDNRGFEGSKTANITIETLCDIMTTNTSDKTAFERYAEVNDLMLSVFEKNCTDFRYSKTVADMQQEKWDSPSASGERQWTWQTCTEFGFYQSSDLGDAQPFGKEFPITFSTRQCQDVYGVQYDAKFIKSAIKWTNANYGGKKLKISKCIFVNGSIDPWHALGITSQNQTTADNVVIFIEGTAHCANMYPDSENDLPQLRAARGQILKHLTEWLKE